MKKINTSPISGTQELLPEIQAVFDKLKTGVAEKYKAHGYLNIETPILERTEILFAKAGGDTEKQIYKVAKTNETMEDATEALRFDHTVPLARYIVEHESDLSFPLKVCQMGENFRGERAQRGRFREFYQCDVDVIGRGELPLFYAADVISTLLDSFDGFELKPSDEVWQKIQRRLFWQRFLKFNPKTTILFDPKASLRFEGDTGPYVQYVCARINSIQRKAGERGFSASDPDWTLLDSPEEKELAVAALRYASVIRTAAGKLDCSLLVAYLLDLAKSFNRFYREKPVLNIDDEKLRSARLALCYAVRDLIADGLKTLTIGVPDAM